MPVPVLSPGHASLLTFPPAGRLPSTISAADLRSALFEASQVSGRRRRARLLSRWPPSAAQLGRGLARRLWPRCLSTKPRLQPPPRRTQRADFPHCAPPSASCRGLWDLSCRGDFRPVAAHSIAVKQLQGVVQPRPTPSLPAEAPSFLSVRQMVPDLLLHPILDEAEALTGVSNREVVHPSP